MVGWLRLIVKRIIRVAFWTLLIMLASLAMRALFMYFLVQQFGGSIGGIRL